jgi:hypothetical protein
MQGLNTQSCIMQSSLNLNLLHVTRTDFKYATKVFTRKRLALGPVLMAFEGGLLWFESGAVKVLMRLRTGDRQWH